MVRIEVTFEGRKIYDTEMDPLNALLHLIGDLHAPARLFTSVVPEQVVTTLRFREGTRKTTYTGSVKEMTRLCEKILDFNDERRRR